MTYLKLSGLVAASAIMLSACTNDPTTNAVVGGLTGAAVGTQIGSGSGNTAAILGGAAIGTAIGANAPVHHR